MASASFTGLVLACVVASLCLSTSALVKSDEHNLSMGERQPNDELLFKKVVRHGLFWFVVQSEEVCFPEDKNDKQQYYITAFECVNKGDEKAYSGTAKLTKGGLGKSEVCIYLEGYRGAKLEFDCFVYGYKEIHRHRARNDHF